MERTRKRLAVARRALSTLEELVNVQPASPIVWDAAIQRFEYTFEATWKAAQVYLREIEGLETGSPKGSVRVALQVGILGEEEARLALVDDRNLTVHAYREDGGIFCSAVVRKSPPDPLWYRGNGVTLYLHHPPLLMAWEQDCEH